MNKNETSEHDIKTTSGISCCSVKGDKTELKLTPRITSKDSITDSTN
jgi:hypothetical protein